MQLLDACDLDHGGRALVTVLEPVEAVVSAGEEPGSSADALGQPERTLHRVRLIQLEVRHHVTGHLQCSYWQLICSGVWERGSFAATLMIVSALTGVLLKT